ncbi:MAG: LacI family transcriptional regulator [Lachnospiraceae bacterium]|nr:LacI family transcriptional regulator [Lachnospiraceae bacterium]
MATIKDIARECGVSIATVSNVVNHTGRVSEKTVTRVMEAADRMGYVPDRVASNLKKRRTNVIGVITEDLTVFNTAEIVDGINEYLDDNGYSFLLGNLRLYKKYNNEFYKNDEYKDAAEREFRVMISQRVSGIIYIGAHVREIDIVPEDCSVPVVVAYGFDKDRKIPSVVYDDELAAYEAVSSLIEGGAKKIGLITGEKKSLHTKLRAEGYKRALSEHGIKENKKLIAAGNWQREGGRKAAEKLMKEDIDAIFSMSDTMSVGVYDYANKSGLKVGKDFRIVSFDNREISAELTPALSSVAIPLSEIGKTAAETMLGMLDGENYEPESLKKLKCRIVKRD